jgi:hypothetical protein
VVTCVIAGRFLFALGRSRSNNVPSNNPKLLQAVPDLLNVLRDPVLDHLGTVPDLARMPAKDQFQADVAQENAEIQRGIDDQPNAIDYFPVLNIGLNYRVR